jgi:polysaccharide biosynthesis/export protein
VVTVTGALQMAEGLRQSADLTKVQVRRTATAGGQPQLINLNLLKLIEDGDTEQDPLLRDGDTVYIPPTTTFDIAQATKIANSSFVSASDKPVRVAVSGEVFRPGPYALGGGTQGTVSSGQGTTGQDTGSATPSGGRGNLPTLTKAIQTAGGITESADIRNIQITRKTSSGKLVTTVNFMEFMSSGDISQDLPLQEGDIISVPIATAAITPEDYKALSTASIAPATITVNVVGEVQKPGALQVPPNTPLNQAILAAGGFSDRAATGKVQLVRLNPNNGTVKKDDIPVDFAKGIQEGQNPVLRNNDTVIVAKSGIARAGTGIGLFTGPLFPVFSLLRLFGIPLP